MPFELQCQSCQVVGEVDEYIEEFECPQCGGTMLPLAVEEEEEAYETPTISISRGAIMDYKNSLKRAKPVSVGFSEIMQTSSKLPAVSPEGKTEPKETETETDKKDEILITAETEADTETKTTSTKELDELRLIAEARERLRQEREDFEKVVQEESQRLLNQTPEEQGNYSGNQKLKVLLVSLITGITVVIIALFVKKFQASPETDLPQPTVEQPTVEQSAVKQREVDVTFKGYLNRILKMSPGQIKNLTEDDFTKCLNMIQSESLNKDSSIGVLNNKIALLTAIINKTRINKKSRPLVLSCIRDIKRYREYISKKR